MNKKTKILATLGPAVNSKQTIQELVNAGVDGFRINLSHGDNSQWESFIDMVREVDNTIPIVVDTKGPEIRLINVSEKRMLESDERITISTTPSDKLPHLNHEVQLVEDEDVLIDDGNISATVIDVSGSEITLRIRSGGMLSNKRKVSVPRTKDHLPILTPEDEQDLRWCVQKGIDAVAVSFARSKEDLQVVREVVGDETFIISKIENDEGVSHLDEIIANTDAVMVARGDLGVELPLEEVPIVQKRIITSCNEKGKPVIVATQMLESMLNHSKPTRAEASDVANAILDGADCVMLSGETAMGNYPVTAVKTMSKIAMRVEGELSTSLSRISSTKLHIAHAISNAVYDLSLNLQPDAIITSTASGFSARMVARFKPQTQLIAVAHSLQTARELNLSWGVIPVLFVHENHEGHETIHQAVQAALQVDLITTDCEVIVTAGVDTMQKGSTNLIEVHTVSDLLEYHRVND